MKQLIQDNYDSIVKRGLITPHTSHHDFLKKLHEEVSEAFEAQMIMNKEDLSFEIADVILTALNYAKHYDIDIEHYLKEKIKINYERANKE